MKIWVLLLCLLCAELSFAKRYRKNAVDRAHRRFSKGILYFSNEIDSFFADDKHEGLPNRSKLKLSFTTHFREAAGPYVIPDLNYSLVLPRTEKRMRLVLESENEERENETSDTNYITQKKSGPVSNNTAAGLRYMINRSGISFYSDTGVIVDVPPRTFIRLTAKKNIMLTNWLLKIKEQVKWVNTTGFTSTLNVDFDKGLTSKFLLRMVNDTLWNDQDYVITFENGPSLFQKIDDKRALSYHAHLISINKPNFEVVNYLFQVTYRQNLYSDWLFMNITPFVNFPREKNFYRTPGFLVRFDAIFGYI